MNWLYNCNPFLWPLLPLLVLWFSRGYYSNRPGKYRTFFTSLNTGVPKKVIIVLILALIVGVFVFEFYYNVLHCKVSDRYMEDTLNLTKKIIELLNNMEVPYWFEYASLLCIVRKTSYNPWDHDQDISTMHPGQDKLAEWVATFEKLGLRTDFDESRDLIQIWASDRPGPHLDIWLWLPDREGDKELLVTKEYSVEYRWRDKKEIFPLQTTAWLGINITIPYDPHTISAKEYDLYAGPGSYMRAIYLRADCVHNLFNGRWFY